MVSDSHEGRTIRPPVLPGFASGAVRGDNAAIAGHIDILERTDWQMPWGDRAALEGVLARLRPRLAIEIGVARGGSLERVAAYSSEVHAFDMEPPPLLPARTNFHQGDSREVVPRVLSELARRNLRVDFALIDGDHSYEGVRGDLEALLASPTATDTVILAHDSFNPVVRAGIEDGAKHAKVGLLHLDLTTGFVARSGPMKGQLWGGFALIEVGEPQPELELEIQGGTFEPFRVCFHDSYETARQATEVVIAKEESALSEPT